MLVYSDDANRVLPSQMQWQPQPDFRGRGFEPVPHRMDHNLNRNGAAKHCEEQDFPEVADSVYYVYVPGCGPRICIVGDPTAVIFCEKKTLPASAVRATFNQPNRGFAPGPHGSLPYTGPCHQIGDPMMQEGFERDQPAMEQVTNLTKEKIYDLIRQRIELLPVKGLKSLAYRMLQEVNPEKRQNNSYKGDHIPAYWPKNEAGKRVWEAGIFHAKGDDLKEFVTHIVALPIFMPAEADVLLEKAQDSLSNTLPSQYTEILDLGTRNLLMFAKDVKNIPDVKKPFERFRAFQYRLLLRQVLRISYQTVEQWPAVEGMDIWIEAAPAQEVRRYNEYLRTEFERVADAYTLVHIKRRRYAGSRSASRKRSASPSMHRIKLQRDTPLGGDVTTSHNRHGSLEDQGGHRHQSWDTTEWHDSDDEEKEIPSNTPYSSTLLDQRRQWQARYANSSAANLTMPAMVLSPTTQTALNLQQHQHQQHPAQPRSYMSCPPDAPPQPYFGGNYAAAAQQYPSPTSKSGGSPDVPQNNFENSIPLDGELFEMVEYP